ncbi:Hypothetical protein A7982_02691 [Minicystis rosea]|nr:Hypothetical protein A7982_02691 [Minicystis rosea]
MGIFFGRGLRAYWLGSSWERRPAQTATTALRHEVEIGPLLRALRSDAIAMRRARALAAEIDGARIEHAEDDEVVRAIERFLARGIVVAHETALGHLTSFGGEAEEAPLSLEQPTPVREETHWIQIGLVDMEDNPVPGAAYRIELPDGEVITGRLGSRGTARIDGLTQTGMAAVVFVELDRDAWMARGETEPRRGEPYSGGDAGGRAAEVVTARAHDCVSSIAFRAGFFPGTVWDDAENRDLRALRENPSTLAPGDEVHVPALRLKQMRCAIDAEHWFRRRGVPEHLQVRLLDADGEPRADVGYQLFVEGRLSASGTTGKDGMLRAPIPPDARTGELWLRDGGRLEKRRIALGRLPPSGLEAGLQSRLRNLGLYHGPIDGRMDSAATEDAIRRFAEAHELPAGMTQEALHRAIERVHDTR